MKILVTGASGFLGAALVGHLARQGGDVIVAGRHAAGGADPQFRQLDLAGSQESMEAALAGVDVLVHLAWNSTPSVSNREPVNDVMTNVAGTVRLFDACARTGVRRIVFASSGGQVYGDADSTAITESTATNPKSAYGIGKLACEKYLALYGALRGISTLSLRIANLYGPGQSMKDGFGVIPTFMSRLARHEAVQIFGDGQTVRDFVFIDDVVDALVKSVYSPATGVLNISSGVGVSIGEIVTRLEGLTGQEARRQFLPARASDPMAIVLANGNALAALGWQPAVAFPEGLARAARGLAP